MPWLSPYAATFARGVNLSIRKQRKREERLCELRGIFTVHHIAFFYLTLLLICLPRAFDYVHIQYI